MKMSAALALLLVVQSPAPQQTRKGQIEGYVVRAGTNEPLADARVTIRRTGNAGQTPLPPQESELAPDSPQAITTDSQGHFIIESLDPGSYQLSAAKNGFARQVYGERAPERPGKALAVSAGQLLKDVTFRLVPTGAVSGRVTDERGEPIPGILVQLLRSNYDARGRRMFQTVSSTRANERGEYRMYLITPGRFFVSAAPAGASPDPSMMAVNHVDEPGFVVTYFPGSLDPSSASSIEIQPGAETSAIDFRMSPQPLFRIRGRVLDARTGGFPRGVQLQLQPKNPGASSMAPSPLAYNSINGTFELRDVAPGPYWIEAQLIPDADTLQLSIGDFLKNIAHTRVDVSNADVENVAVTFSPGFSFPGHIEIESSGNAESRQAKPLMVSLEPQESMPLLVLPQPVNADGTFTLQNVLPGDYRIQIEGRPANSYIKSAHLGRTDVLNGISFSGPVPESLDVVLGTTSAEIQGIVADSDRNPIQAAQVVLIPNRERSRIELYRTATTDQNGSFTMQTIVPGEYKLFAWEDLEPYAYNDPDFLNMYEERGTPVSVSESTKLTVETKIIPAHQ